MKNILFTLLILTYLSGCRTIPKDLYDNEYDVNSLRTTDKTFQLTEPQTIKVIDDKKIEMVFDTNWYLVHNDWIKTFNKNQDALLQLLEDLMASTENIDNVSNRLEKLSIKRSN